VRTRLRSAAILCSLVGLGCPRGATQRPDTEDRELPRKRDEGRRNDGDLRVDPSRCSGDGLDLAALVAAGLCTIPAAEATPLPSPDLLIVEAPSKLSVAPGERLEFDLVLRNASTAELTVDLRFRRFLPLAPESTVRLDEGPAPDDRCTLRAISTEPPPERINLPPGGELAIPCEWHANTRLVDPESYVGSECPDFPELAPGRYRSVFRISGGGGTQREVTVDIEVPKPKKR
jgi:hypothetical protein